MAAHPTRRTFSCNLPGFESSAIRNAVLYFAKQTPEGRALALRFEGERLAFKVFDAADHRRAMRLVEEITRRARQGRE